MSLLKYVLSFNNCAGTGIKASPYARKLAAEAGVSLAGITGSGPEGRIVAEDVQRAIASGKVCSYEPGEGQHSQNSDQVMTGWGPKYWCASAVALSSCWRLLGTGTANTSHS